MSNRILLILLIFLIFKCNQTFSQEVGADREWGSISTAVPFLMLGPDARSGGMGNIGVATSPDGNSIYWNASKLAFIEKELGVNISYTHWLNGLVGDIGLGNASFYKKLGDKQTIGASLRYFSLGSITYTNEEGISQGTYRPKEFAFDVAYARQLSKNFSAALTGKFIYSNLTLGQDVGGIESQAGTSVALDVSMFYSNLFKVFGKESSYNIGMAVNNIGTKISYVSNPSSTQKHFIPTNLRLGFGVDFNIGLSNIISVTGEMTKLLVPTPPVYDENGNPIPPYLDNNVSALTGMAHSFYDAPYGEEIQEITFAGGLEYSYKKRYIIRGGYFYENPNKGNHQYFTLGAGFRYKAFGLDISYLIANNQNNSLNNALRFTLSFEIE